jgi:hypothetical protein
MFYSQFFFLGGQFYDVAELEDLAIFGYKLEMKVKVFNFLLYLAISGTMDRNLAIFS